MAKGMSCAMDLVITDNKRLWKDALRKVAINPGIVSLSEYAKVCVIGDGDDGVIMCCCSALAEGSLPK